MPGEAPWTEEPGGLQSMAGVAESQTRLSDPAQHSVTSLSQSQL